MRRTIFDDDHHAFRESVRGFLTRDALPNTERWEAQGMVDRDFWRTAALQGLLGFEAPEQHGGSGISDFRFNAVLQEEVAYTGAVGDNFSLQNDILIPYLLHLTDEAQKERWLPGLTSGDALYAIAMSEPGAGSDLRAMTSTARREGDRYILDGAKTFVTSGIQAERVIVAARVTGESTSEGHVLLMVEQGMEGFERGRKLGKVGRRAQDTSELFFDGVSVPVENRLGEEGQGFRYLMAQLPRERLSIAVAAVSAAEHALELTLDYVRERHAFGQPIGSFQHNRFVLADLHSRVWAARSHIDACIVALNSGELTGAEAAAAKAFTTDLQFEVLDHCMQLHGGYGYMDEYPISRLWRDGRVQRIYGGTNEVMYEIVGRSLQL